MKLSVVILNYKVPFYLLQCIESVEKAIQQINAEIIVVDNNSEDESCSLVKKHFPKVSLIQNKENVGFSKGNNQGVTLARGEYICLLNPDTVVGETTFHNLLKFAEKHKNAGIISLKYIDGTGNFLPECKRNLPTPKVALQKLFNSSKKYYSSLDENETGKVEILAGAFMLMKKERYVAVGGLDEDYFMYGEDIDLSYKFLKANYQNYYVGSEIMLHYKGESTAKDAVYRKRFYGAMKVFYKKHFQKGIFLNFMVSAGLRIARMQNSWKAAPKPFQKTYSWAYFLGDEVEGLTHLNAKINSEIILKKREHSILQDFKNSLVIFNAGDMDYQKIFSIMENEKNKGNYFRIKPRNFNFIVGSDQSTDKGEVIHY